MALMMMMMMMIMMMMSAAATIIITEQMIASLKMKTGKLAAQGPKTVWQRTLTTGRVN